MERMLRAADVVEFFARTFYNKSIDNAYLWVQEQFHPYEQSGRPGSYQSTVTATKYGYNKWVKMGKPKWNETAEHKEVMRLSGTL